MRRATFITVGLFLCAAHPVCGQEVQAGILAGTAWPASGTTSSFDANIGGEGWIALELPGLPLMPRASFGADWFWNGDPVRSRVTRGGRLDVLVDLPAALLDLFGFAGIGVYSSDSRTFASGSSTIGWVGAETAVVAGVGTRIGLGPFRGITEVRYLAVIDPEFTVVQLRLGVGL